MPETAIRNPADCVSYIERSLGAPTVKVELTSQQLTDAVDDAIRLFNRYLFIARYNVVTSPVAPGVDQATHYWSLQGGLYYCKECNFHCETLTEMEAHLLNEHGITVSGNRSYLTSTGGGYIQMSEDVVGVNHVSFVWPTAERDVLRMSLFEILSRMAYPPFALGEWYMLRMYSEMFQRVRGSDPGWRYDPVMRRLYLDLWSGPYDVCYVTAHNVTVPIMMEGSKQRYSKDFLAACTAYAKERLSMVRRKWGGVPAPAGTLMLDGAELATEAKEALDRVEEALKKLARAMYLPIVG